MTYVQPDTDGEPPPTDHVVLLASVPPGLHVDATLLGTRWPIESAPEACELVLPCLPAERVSDFATPLAPPEVPAAARMFSWWTGQADDVHWGKTWLTGDSTSTAHLAHVLIVSAYNPPDNGNHRRAFSIGVGDAVESWLNALAQWIEVLSHVDLQPNPKDGPRVGLCSVHNVVLSSTVSGDRIGHFGYARSPVLSGPHSHSVTIEQWSAACDFTNRALAPPPAHLYLRDARAALRRDDARRAAVDACAAAEVALAESLSRSHPLASSRAEEVKATIGKTSGVVQLFDLHQAMAPIDGVTRGAVMDRLAGPRNDAAHGSATPERDDAREAVHLATRVVEAISPLPDGYIRVVQANRGTASMHIEFGRDE
jgi:hypothetical protein